MCDLAFVLPWNIERRDGIIAGYFFRCFYQADELLKSPCSHCRDSVPLSLSLFKIFYASLTLTELVLGDFTTNPAQTFLKLQQFTILSQSL